jgi:CRP/FNR family transcriptional regulator
MSAGASASDMNRRHRFDPHYAFSYNRAEMNPQVEALRRISLFTDLPQETLTRLARVSIRRTYEADETIILDEAPCRAAYFVAKGHVRASRISPDGREQVLARLGPGQSFNTVPPFQPDGVNHATVRAVDEVTLYAVAKEDLIRLVSEDAHLALTLLRDFADRLDHLTDLVEDLSLRTVRGRLARFLLEQAEAGAVTPRWTQAEIAARLGTVREMIGRTLRAFADAGLIRIDRQRIVLLDGEGLEAEANR